MLSYTPPLQKNNDYPLKRICGLKASNGFTLIEMMLVVALIAVLATIALPQFSSTTAQRKVDTTTDRLADAIRFTRTAATANQAVAIMERLDTSSTGRSWMSGWNVYLDSNGNGSLDSGELLTMQDELYDIVFMTSQDTLKGLTRLTFLPNGFLSGGAIQVSVCSELTSNVTPKGFSVPLSGHITAIEPTSCSE